MLYWIKTFYKMKLKNIAGSLYIGTSGWSYKHWKGVFYPESIKSNEHFNYYLQHFDTVEINNSFYRMPSLSTFNNWKKAVPQDFIYALKANRAITHIYKLKNQEQVLEEFITNAAVLKSNLGPILFQLPPSWNVNIERLHDFLQTLPLDYRYVFEFRNKTWHNDDVYNLLKKFNCAFCIYELEGYTTPYIITSDFVYIRLHGPGNKYQGDYSDKTLLEWAGRIKSWLSDKDVFIYFDNDEKGYAVSNATQLKKLIVS